MEYSALVRIASSIPEMPGSATSEMSRSGAFNRAVASASSGQVKHLPKTRCSAIWRE